MEKLARFGLLAALACAGCGASALRGRANTAAGFAKLQLPRRVGPGNYRPLRQVYEALEPDHPQRPALRAKLRRYLLAQVHQYLERDDESSAEQAFFAATTLYPPEVVYSRPPKDEKLYRTAEQLVERFSPRGDAVRVLPALCVQISLKPKDPALKRKFRTIVRWMGDRTQALDGRATRGHHIKVALERTLHVWPSKFVLEQLHRVRLSRLMTLARLGGLSSRLMKRSSHHSRRMLYRHLFARLPMPRMAGYHVARMWLWVNRPKEALARLKKLSLTEHDFTLQRLLERVVEPSASADDFIRLAEEFDERHADVALSICRRAARRFPNDARLQACTGRLASQTQNVLLSIKSYERAVNLEPKTRRYAERLAEQFRNRILELAEAEQLDRAKKLLGHLERFHRIARRRLGKPLRVSLAPVYYAVGQAQFHAGKTGRAERSLRRSLAAGATPQVLLQLAVIRIKSGKPAKAQLLLRQAEGLLPADPRQRTLLRARLEQLRARSFALEGDSDKSTAADERALEALGLLLKFKIAPARAAEIQLHRAQSLYALQRKSAALDALERAIDAAPHRKKTYADVVAMLATHGHLPEALDAYHRALGRPEVGEYLKAYLSFWIIGLSRRANLRPDPLAIEFLRKLSGPRWYHRLAKLVLGTATFDELAREAKDAARRAELYFYQAERLLARGDVARAKDLWRKVVDTKMMAFFEYDMALHNLRLGPSDVRDKPLDRHARTDGNGAGRGAAARRLDATEKRRLRRIRMKRRHDGEPDSPQ